MYVWVRACVGVLAYACVRVRAREYAHTRVCMCVCACACVCVLNTQWQVSECQAVGHHGPQPEELAVCLWLLLGYLFVPMTDEFHTPLHPSHAPVKLMALRQIT